jgi:CrcB protein
MRLLYIGIMGVLGVMARYGVGLLAARIFPPPFPYGTFLINLVGSFLIGLVYALGMEAAVLTPDLRVGLMVGFLGGFTTFSSYCLETYRLAEEGELLFAAAYVGLSTLLGLCAVAAGLALGRLVLRMQIG